MNYDREFLKQLDLQKNKVVYARITSLTFDESPVETIEGRVSSGGSINIDGASALRRTCSLSMVAQDVNIHDYYWGLNTKFKLEIGIDNFVDSNYPDRIWFKQGIYVITSFSCSVTTNNYSISIQGKDKMCLLDGSVGGSLHASTTFDSYDETDENGNVFTKKYPIKDIIRDSVHQFAGEPFHKIIINDLDDLGLELLEYRYDEPMFLFRKVNDDTYFNGTFNAAMPCWTTSKQQSTIGAKDDDGNYIHTYDPLMSTLTGDLIESTQLYLENPNTNNAAELVCIAKIDYGETAGYRAVELVYAGDLVGNVGEALTSILDKIKNMLGEFEYFYDLDGRFVFQKKQTYLNTSWTPIVNASYVEGNAYATASEYDFTNSELITAFNNNPNLLNLRNDFSVWGTRKSVTGNDLPVHMRYAIDKKPVSYTNYEGTTYTSDDWDWRELIFQMQADYRKHNHDDDFELKIITNNKDEENQCSLYPNGCTGYEQYYIDIEGFWRELYRPEDLWEEGDSENFYPALDENGNPHPQRYWNKMVFETPETLNFWFDFLDTEGELNQFSCKMIGNRPKAINDSAVKAIYFRDTPLIIFTTAEDYQIEEHKSGYRYFNTSNLDSIFSISSQGKSAKERVDELLYNHSYCSESVSITSIPIYYLEPNTRVHVYDENTDINGEYIVSKLTIPLTYNGTMSITATKAPERLI